MLISGNAERNTDEANKRWKLSNRKFNWLFN